MLITRRFNYRLGPSNIHRSGCAQQAGAARFVYNWGIDRRKTSYEQENKSLSYYDQNNELVELKKQEETSWLKEIHSQVLQQSLKDLDLAFQHFFRRLKEGKEPGFPRFKCKGVHDSFRYPQGVRVEGCLVYLPKIGWVKFRKSRELQGTIKQTTVFRKGDHWYVSFCCEIEVPDPILAPICEEKAVGIDMGLKHFATLAIGVENRPQTIKNPRFFTRYLSRLRILSKRLSKKVKGSQNWIKAKRQLAKLHTRIRNCRQDFAHQLSTLIVKSHDIICVEGLAIKELIEQSSRSYSRAICDASWRHFLRCLEYKAKELGKHFVQTDRYLASTQTCSSCGHRKKMTLQDRIYHCKHCFVLIDRDLNSAIFEKAAGMTVLNACGASC